ncbi:MAG: hypothetical protein ACJ73S_26275 [Mycobacteriales bacterium]
MTDNGISRRGFLGTAAALAAAVPLLPAPALAAARSPSGRAARARVGAACPGLDIVRVTDDGYAVHVEPSLAANPRRPGNLLGASQAWTGDGADMIATYASFDGGRTWRAGGALPLPPGGTEANDVTIAFDGAGRGYVCATVIGSGGRDDRGAWIWRTADGGRTFAPPVPVVSGVFVDHPCMTVDTTGGVHVAWVAEDHDALGYGRSTDGGDTFAVVNTDLPPVAFSVNAPVVAAGADGGVYVLFAGGNPHSSDPDDDDKEPPPGDPQDDVQPMIAYSSADGGLTFGGPVVLGRGVMDPVLAGGVKPVASPALAASRGRPAAYAAYVSHETGAPRSSVCVAATDDRGRTWAEPVTVSAGDGVVLFMPQLATDPGGRLVLTAFALSGGLVDVLMWTSPACRPPQFGEPRRITSRPFDPNPAAGGVYNPKHGAWWIGDYQGLVWTPAGVRPFWNATTGTSLELYTTLVPY